MPWSHEARREAAALALTCGASAALLLAWPRMRPRPEPLPAQAVQVTLAPPAPLPDPLPPAPPPPAVAAPAPSPTVPPPAAAPDLPALSRLVPLARHAPAPRAAPAMARAAASVPAPEAAADTDADARLEDRYVAALHALIAARTEPPRDAAYRLTHPSGTVEVTFVLDRDGTVREARVQAGSGSASLDRQALAIVRRGMFPPFPAGAYPGEATHAFLVAIVFRSDGDGAEE